MHFEARELPGYAVPVSPDILQVGEVYFAVQFLDEELLIPIVEPFVFLGRNLTQGDEDSLYFQTVDSFRAGIRYESASDEEAYGAFQISPPGSIQHIFQYERALDVLMTCALKRREKPPRTFIVKASDH